MSDINFLQSDDEKKKPEPKHKDERAKPAIEWSKPSGQPENKSDKSAWSGLVHKNEKATNGLVDKKKLKNSRQEILKLIKEQKSGSFKQDPKGVKTTEAGKILVRAGLAERLKAIFTSKKQHEVFIDLEKVFKEEKNKRSDLTSTFAKPEISTAPRPDQARPEPPKPVQPAPAVKPVKIKQPNRLMMIKRLTNNLKKFFSGLSRRQPRLSKNIYIKKENKQPVKPVKPAPLPDRAQKAAPVPAKEEEKKWESSNIIETNLINGEVINFFDWRKKIIILLNAVILSCLFLALGYGGLIYWQKQKQEQIAPLLARIESIGKDLKIAEADKNELFNFQKKLKIAKTLLDRHVYWTNFFKFLENYTLPEVYFNNFSGDINGNYVLDSRTTNYDNIAKQLIAFKQAGIVLSAQSQGGQILGQSQAGGEIKFQLELSVDKKIFVE